MTTPTRTADITIVAGKGSCGSLFGDGFGVGDAVGVGVGDGEAVGVGS